MTLNPPTQRAVPLHDHLGTVIPFTPRPPAPDRAAEILDRRVGSGWDTLPGDGGRAALRGENLLREAPAGFDPAVTVASDGVSQARDLVASARIAIDLLTDEVLVLTEALGADLASLALDELDAVAAAVLDMPTVPTPSSAWGRRAAAESADVVLGLLAPSLREAAASHERLYERFTDHVWEVPAHLLITGARRRRCLSRARLRRQLKAASRTGAIPGRMADVVQEIIEVRAARARLATVRPLLAHHLGVLDRGVLTDVDAATQALAAVRRLQQSMELVLDDERLERLLQANAFESDEVLAPARAIRRTLAAWVRDVDAAGGRGALAVHPSTLTRWVDEVEHHLTAIDDGIEGMERLGRSGSSVQQVVDALILREHLADQAVEVPASSDTTKSWSASS